MVAAPAAGDAVRRAKELPALKIGLHVVLADGWAASSPLDIPGLSDARGWLNDRMVVNGLRFFALPSVRRQLEAEIRRQFEAFQRTGLLLDHVNAHKHFHLHPTLLSMLLRIGREFGVAAVRVPAEPAWFQPQGGAGFGRRVGTALLDPWLALMKSRLRNAGIAHNDQVFGLARSGRMDEDTLLEILGRLPPGATEIYLHPATLSGGGIAASMSGYRHADELRALLSTRVKEAVRASGAQLGGFRDLIDARSGA
jgi:hopanoid biosynthesis associated protein HpnK